MRVTKTATSSSSVPVTDCPLASSHHQKTIVTKCFIFFFSCRRFFARLKSQKKKRHDTTEKRPDGLEVLARLVNVCPGLKCIFPGLEEKGGASVSTVENKIKNKFQKETENLKNKNKKFSIWQTISNWFFPAEKFLFLFFQAG
jgi:hypothetical protein